MSSLFIVTGLPSVPIVTYQVLAGAVRFSMRVLFSGATDGSFRFVIDITYTNNGSLLRTEVLSFPSYTNDETVVRDVFIPEGGSFSFTVRARNGFGNSEKGIMTEGLTIQPAG